jgi:hypothetical protein
MNTKDKHYKKWLKLSEEYWESFRKDDWAECSKQTGELEKELYTCKFKKFNRWHSNPPHWYVTTFNRSDRKHNKQALAKNISTYGCDYNENPHEADWFGFLGGWESEYIEYKYHHKNSAKWMWY